MTTPITKNEVSPEWSITLRPDGVVVDVDGGAPEAWLGERLESIADARVTMRAKLAARGLVTRVRKSAGSRKFIDRVRVEPDAPGAPAIELVAVAAVPLRRTEASLIGVLMQTTETLIAQAKATGVTFHVVADEEMPDALVIDTEKVAWCVATLVGSALRYLATSDKHNRSVRVEARYERAAREIALAVHDNGPGIADDKLARLLRRTPDDVSPAGLALVMLQDVVVAHGGRVAVESSTLPANHGTTVTLYFPVD